MKNKYLFLHMNKAKIFYRHLFTINLLEHSEFKKSQINIFS